MRRLKIMVGWLMLMATACGCAPSAGAGYRAASTEPALRTVHRGLVTADAPVGKAAAAAGRAEARTWELSRNDGHVGLGPPPVGREVQALQVFSRDRVRTIDGRPVDTSSTVTWSIRRRVTP